MQGYNDYQDTVRRWLRYYNQLKITATNMQEDVVEQERILELGSSAPISKYDETPGGGSELTPTEAAAERAIKIQTKVNETRLNLGEIQRIIKKVDNALEGLDCESRELVKAHFFDGQSWRDIGYARHYTERWARKKGNRAIRDMAFMVFGIRARPEQLSFVFAE